MGSVASSHLFANYRAQAHSAAARSRQSCGQNFTRCKLHWQTAGAHGAAAVRGSDAQSDALTCSRSQAQSSPTTLSGSPT